MPAEASSTPGSSTVSSREAIWNRTTVMLSSPPLAFASSMSAWAAAVMSARCSSITSRIRVSSTMDVSPSEQSMNRSPGFVPIENASTSTSGSVPSTRVITERCGWASASSGDRRPERTSSPTSE